MGFLFQYRKLIALLTLWVVGCCLFYFRDVVSPSFSRHYTHVINIAPARDQQEPVNSTSATGRTTLPIKTEFQSTSKSLNGPELQKESRSVTTHSSNVVSTPTKPTKTTEVTSKTKPHPDKMLTTYVTNHTKLNSTTTLKGLPVSVATTSTKNMTHLKNTSVTPTFSSSPTMVSSPSANSSRENKAAKLLCVRFAGRLGNELFEYASTLGLALTLNRTPVFLGSTHLRTVLKNFKESSINMKSSELQQRCNKAKGMGEVSCCKYKEQMTQLDPQYDYRISMYLQSYRYFDNHTAEIRKAVTFNDKIQTQANKTVQELRQQHKSSTLVGAHIRHGDMASGRNQKLGYPLASPDYINKSLSYFSQLYPNCVFVVASDSVQWCKENFPKSYNVSYLSGNEPAVDMLILASLDHVITSFGSFSWWIGYLSHGRVVYMKDFIKANTYIGSAFNPKGRDYIYPGWTAL